MPATKPRWVGTWMAAPQLTERDNLPPAPGLSGSTLRQNLLVSVGGSRLRVSFSNEWGQGPVSLRSVHLARATIGSGIDAATDQALSFDGMSSVTIPKGETRTSDPLDHVLPEMTRLAVTIYFGDVPRDITGHPGSRTTSYLRAGDASTAANMNFAAMTDHWYFLTGIDVETATESAAVVALGDSITDGRGSTTNANDRWPDALSRRLRSNPSTAQIGVLNAGIGGNAVVSGGLGPTVLERFERDVLTKAGVRWVIALNGVNDIGSAGDAGVVDALIDAYAQLIQAAHERDILVYGGTLSPLLGENSPYNSAIAEAARQAVNGWIRNSGAFDDVIDFDAAVRDPSHPSRLLSAFDCGDGLHLSPAGYQAMADAVDLALFDG